MKQTFLYYAVVCIYILTSLATLAGILGIVKFQEEYKKPFVTGCLLASVGAVIALFRNTKFSDSSRNADPRKYKPSEPAAKTLNGLTLIKETTPAGLPQLLGMEPTAGDFPTFLSGVAELLEIRAIRVQVDGNKLNCSLTTFGLEIINRSSKHLQKFGSF